MTTPAPTSKLSLQQTRSVLGELLDAMQVPEHLSGVFAGVLENDLLSSWVHGGKLGNVVAGKGTKGKQER